jgi:hypothetical protein
MQTDIPQRNTSQSTASQESDFSVGQNAKPLYIRHLSGIFQ